MPWVLLWGCAVEPAPEVGELTDPLAWDLVGTEMELFPAPEDSASCEAPGYGPEGNWFEVQTDICPYGTFSQPILHSVKAGQRIEVTLWHEALWAEEPAEGYVGLQLGGTLWWELTVPIPHPAAIYREEFSAPAAITEGEPIYLSGGT